ncbi:MAG: sensor histidine kinase [Bacteroidales bacterium]|nr:sensor histidine kinase [Bacteroidales bacterium]
MKSLSPRELAIFIALILALVFAGSIYLLFSLSPANWHIFLLLGSIVFFILGFFIINSTLNKVIFEKIQPVYKTIHDFTVSQKELRKQLADKDMLGMMNKEVEDWAEKKTKEIKKLKQLEKYRKDFLGNVMHELKTPIFNIQGYVLTLLDGGLEDVSINKLYLERTEKSINRMISIVEDLEAISRFESGELKLNIEEFDIIRTVEEVFEIMEMKAKNKNIKLVVVAGNNKNIKVLADRKRVHDVLNNLIINSINYGVKGGKTTVSFMDMGQNVLIDVSDNGIGISEKDIPRIFERFYRTDKSRSRDQGGTGLGLAIVKHIIEAHNQTINVRSRVNKGSSFVFTLRKA